VPERSPASSPGAAVAYAFAPLHKRAFGIAVGAAAALVVFLATAIDLLRGPEPGLNLHLLSEYFSGYTVSWTGALIGAAWAWFSGFVVGWFVAFVRNLGLAIAIFVIRTRAELSATRDFLDHV